MQNWDEFIQGFEEKIGYAFKDKQLIKEAFTHKSYTNEQTILRHPSYERVEFLGDAVLDLIISEYLMDSDTLMEEGDLTKLRSRFVCESALAHNAKKLDVGKYILLGKGETRSGGSNRASIAADVMEAIIGALYRDGGLEAARDFVRKFVITKLPARKALLDSKSMTQEYIMKKNLGSLKYVLVDTSGPEHDKTFHVNLYLEEQLISKGSGKNKKTAEQQAAKKALPKIKSRYEEQENT